MRDAQRAAIDAAMESAVTRAKGAAPVETGRLRASIEIIGPAREERQGVVGTWGVAGAPYAIPVELGHVARDGSQVAPRPFLRPAQATAARGLGRRIRNWLKRNPDRAP
ncbi:MAG: HK97 gp10 family phage protein [Geminicoccaceae bacterium]